MKMLGVIQWEGAYKAVALCYANLSTDLKTKVNTTELMSGSLAYLGNGDVYVFNGTQWNKMGE